MSHRMADWVEKKMLKMEDYIVAVKKLWYMHCEESEVPRVALEELAQILKNDTRFYYIEEPAEEWKEDEEEVAKMEKMGFYKGPKVMLHSRIPTKKQLMESITKNIDKLMLNLRKAYEIRPKGDDEAEDELIDVMLRADQLKKEIIKVLSEEQVDKKKI